MKIDELMASANDSVSAKRVYSEPYEVDGVTVITAARVAGGGGGGGGGGGQDAEGIEGAGGGFGVHGRPAGAYVVKDGRVQWIPAVDVHRIFYGVCGVAIAYLLTRAWTERARVRTSRRAAAAQGADRVATALLRRSE